MENTSDKIKVLFVCLGNICRSPTAEALMSHHLKQKGYESRFEIDSAGTDSYHSGEAPDARSQAIARQKGVDMTHIASRQIQISDLNYYNHILVMDNANYKAVSEMSDNALKGLAYLLEFDATNKIKEVPDPYFGKEGGFERVFEMIEKAVIAFIKYLEINYTL